MFRQLGNLTKRMALRASEYKLRALFTFVILLNF